MTGARTLLALAGAVFAAAATALSVGFLPDTAWAHVPDYLASGIVVLLVVVLTADRGDGIAGIQEP